MPKTYMTYRFGQYNLPQFGLQFVVEDMIWFVWNSVHVMTRYEIICCANFMYTVIKFQKIQYFIKQHRFYSLFWSSHRLHHLQTAITQDWRNARVWFWLHFKAYCLLSYMKKYQRPEMKIEIVIVNKIKVFPPKKVQNRGLSDEWKHLKVKTNANLFKNCF